jgi:hypothetical protein
MITWNYDVVSQLNLELESESILKLIRTVNQNYYIIQRHKQKKTINLF